MNSELLQTAQSRLGHLISEVASFAEGIDSTFFLVGIGALIWLQLMRMNRTLGKSRGVSTGNRRIENLESDVNQLTRELHALHTYVTTNKPRIGAD
jgi:hypothetical protein